MFDGLLLDADASDYPFHFETHMRGNPHLIQPCVPFPYLTPTALTIVRGILETRDKEMRSSERTPCFLRGLGYTSSFIRNLCYHPDVLSYLRPQTGIHLQPHYLLSNVGHVNKGVPNDREVDRWHYDSVAYVLILLISDPNTFEGGILEYENERAEVVPVHFSQAGYAVFMKGSQVKHHVTSVKTGIRLSMIHSYIDRDDPIDRTTLSTFDQEVQFSQEYACRHVYYPSETL